MLLIQILEEALFIFFNAITGGGNWRDVEFEGCYPSLPVLADDEYAIVTAMPFQYYGAQIMHPNSFMMAVDVFKDNVTKQVTLSLRGPNGQNPTDNKNSSHRIILPAIVTGLGGGLYARFLKGSGIIENGIEKPIFFPIMINMVEDTHSLEDILYVWYTNK